MARFMVKASEFKNVCKAVNDRKLAELKKEIIEILKKQDEKDVKKAIDYFNSQEGHYTHLEKSLISGKWIQKAGYGVGTVRIWKGKKYKKIAPGKWARVFDKEGRGTNIAIGKLIARVQKIDNVEDLMAFVMENKQRFVDENGIDLPVLDKLRAAVGVKNENLSGESSSYTYGVGEDVSREKNKIFEDKEKITKEEAELHKVSRKLSQIPTSELKQRKAKLDRWIENKTRNKRESINNAIFKDSYKKEVDAINKELEKRSKGTSKPAEKTDGKYDKELVDSWKDDYKNFSTDALKEKIEEYTKVLERAKNDNPSPDQRVAVKQNEHRLKALNELLEEKKNKPAEKKTKTQEDYEKEYEQSLKGKDDAETLDNIVEAYDKVAKRLRPEAKAKGMNPNELNDPELEALGKLRLVYSEKNISEGEKKYREELEKLSGRMKDAINNEFGYEEESEAEKKTKTKEVPFGGVDKNDEGEGIKYLEMADKINEVARKGELKVGDAIFKVDKEGKEWAVRSEIANAIRCKEGIDKINAEFEKTAKPKLEAELKEKLDKIKEKLPEIIKEGKLEENKKLVDERLKRYSEYADEGTTVNEVISKYKNKLINKLEKHVKDNELFTSKNETDIELLSDIDHQVELCSNNLSAAFYTECKKLLEESEAEKTQNRSEAMKGNKNAYKGGHDDEPAHNKVSKNGVYYTFDGFSGGVNRSFRQAKDLPQNIKDNINNSVKRYLDYVDNYTDEGYKKVANDMIKNPEKYQNISMEDFTKETGYDKEDVREIVKLKYSMEFAEKLRNFNLDETMISKDVEQNFRDEIYPVSLKQNIEEGFLPDQIADIEAQKAAKAEKKENVVKKPSGKIATTNPDKLKPIATNEKIADGKVKMPYSKELSDEIKQLVNTALKDKNAYSRAFLTKVYYENGNLVATDGKALKILKVGELDGIENGSYVDIDNSKDGITITKNEDFTKNNKYPNYNRVLPDNNKEKIVLDNKALISKIRDLKKDGSITGKDSYVTFDIKGNDLMLDGVKVGDVSAAKFDDDEEANFFNMDVNILTPYLKGESSELISSPNNEKAMYIGDESTINVIMPQNKWTYRYDSNGNQIKEIRRKDYDSQRASKAQEDEIKASRKAAIKQVNQEYVDDTINRVKQSISKPGFADKMVSQLSEWKTEHLKNLYKQAKVDIDHLMETKDFLANTFGSYTNKHFNTSPSVLIAQNYAMKQFPQIVKEIERLLTERGEKIEKSLFDDFIVDVFEADEDEEIEEDKENESLFNDYSAEQPELFNSTEMKVQEAFNRCNCCL